MSVPGSLFLTNHVCGLTVDSAGNVVVATNANVVKLDPQLKNVLFSIDLGGPLSASKIGALALDAQGNIYVTGNTSAPDGSVSAFVSEFSSDGKSRVFSAQFGDPAVSCAAVPDECPPAAYTQATAIAVDTAGNVVIAGSTIANHLPVTPGGFGPTCGDCGISILDQAIEAGFVAKFAPRTSKLLAATYIPVNANAVSSVATKSLAADPAGDIVISGAFWPPALSAISTGYGVIMKFDGASLQRLFVTLFGGLDFTSFGGFGLAGTGVTAVALDSQGLIWFTGTSPANLIPAPAGTPVLGGAYLAALAPDGSVTGTLFTAPPQIAGSALALTPSGITALGSAGALLTAVPGARPSLVSIANSAGEAISNAVAPIELISLYGPGIGPALPRNAEVLGGAVTSALSNVQVLFDGIPAPLLYAGSTQINAIVPRQVAGESTTQIQIITPSVRIDGPTMQVEPSQPGVALSAIQNSTYYSAPPFAAALNQDGSVNSASNPAQLGSVVSVWVSGAGLSTFRVPDGTIRNAQQTGFPALSVAAFQAPAAVVIFDPLGMPPGPLSLEVTYAGDAAGMVAGVTRVNLRMPESLRYLSTTPAAGPAVAGVKLQVGDASSESFSIYVKPPQ